MDAKKKLLEDLYVGIAYLNGFMEIIIGRM